MFLKPLIALILATSIGFAADDCRKQLSDTEKAQMQEIHTMHKDLREKRIAFIDSIKQTHPELAKRLEERMLNVKERHNERKQHRGAK